VDVDSRRRAASVVRRRSVAPGAGALGLICAIAAYSIVFGITFVALALRLRSDKNAVAAARLSGAVSAGFPVLPKRLTMLPPGFVWVRLFRD
jgi:hypothetical protein